MFEIRLNAFKIGLIFFSIWLFLSALAEMAIGVERRRDPFIEGENAQGYYIIPAPYSLKGIGSGVAVAGSVTNVLGSYTDVSGFVLTGDIEGFGVVVTELHLIDKSLLLDAFTSRITELRARNYDSRGMDTNDEDYYIIGITNIRTYLTRFTKTHPGRVYEASLTYINSSGHLNKLYDKDGEPLSDLDSDFDNGSSVVLGFRIDKSDDYQDPRKGFVAKASISKSLSEKEENGDHPVAETELSLYIPMRSIDTWVFDAFYSRSIIVKEGETNTAVLEKQLGPNCKSKSPAAQKRCDSLVQNTKDQNKYGNSTSLGGRNRLRAYPQLRFTGSKTVFFGTEYRLNFSETMELFDIFLAKGTKSNFQVAFFGEAGSVVDKEDELFDKFANSVGIGFRIVLGSGFVFRIDYAVDTQGNNQGFTAIVGYPWDSF